MNDPCAAEAWNFNLLMCNDDNQWAGFELMEGISTTAAWRGTHGFNASSPAPVKNRVHTRFSAATQLDARQRTAVRPVWTLHESWQNVPTVTSERQTVERAPHQLFTTWLTDWLVGNLGTAVGCGARTPTWADAPHMNSLAHTHTPRPTPTDKYVCESDGFG